MKKYMFVVCFVLVIIVLMPGCDPSTKPKTGSISGRVTLVNDTGDPTFDPVDYFGVTVELYEIANVDTALSRIMSQYPQIGTSYTQNAMFDHRTQIPVKTVQTNGQGEYSISGVSQGIYNVAFRKDGWGYKYMYGVQIDASTKAYETKISSSINLYPEKHLSGAIDGGYVFLEDHCYVVSSDISIHGDVIIENGALLRIASTTNILVFGNVATNSSRNADFSMITCVEDPNLSSNYFAEFRVIGNVNISNLRIDSSIGGFRAENGEATLQNCIIMDGIAGFLFLNCSSVNVSNSIAYKIRDDIVSVYTGYAGFYTIGCDNVSMNKLILLGNNSGVKIKDFSYGQVFNSYFAQNQYACEVYSSQARVHHNIFTNSTKYDIRLCGHQLNPLVDYNNLYSTNGIIVGLDPNYNYVNCNPTISNNNILASSISLKMVYNNANNPDARYNYYGSTDESIINQRIFDGNDYNPHDGSNGVTPVTGTFSFIPFRLQFQHNYGISGV